MVFDLAARIVIVIFIVSVALHFLKKSLFKLNVHKHRYIIEQPATFCNKIRNLFFKHIIPRIYSETSTRILISLYLTLIFLPSAVAMIFFPKQIEPLLLPLLLFGLSAMIFVAIQLPTLLRPSTYVVAVEGTPDLEDYSPYLESKVRLTPGRINLVLIQLTNLGQNLYRNCSVFIQFPKAIVGLSQNDSRYNNLPFPAKKFSYRQKTNQFYFTPLDNYLSVAPTNHLIFSLLVNVPKNWQPPERKKDNKTDWNVKVFIRCETRFGETESFLEIEKVQPK